MNKKGFTLVEMIVVIAIIAILAAVIIPTTSGFIDRARLSNDRQNATRMTQVLEIYAIENNDEGPFEPGVVRTILDTFSDESFSLEPSSRDAGYFYLPNSNRIIVLKYDEAEGAQLHQENMSAINLFNTLNVSAFDISTITMPEQIFGLDRLLITNSGHPIPDMVRAVRNLSNVAPEDFDAAYDNLLGDIEALGTGLRGLLRNADRFKAALTTMVETFDPLTTLYISNTRWHTAAPEDDPVINRVVFASNLVHVPAYNGPAHLRAEDLETPIVFPSSVRTFSLRTGAFEYDTDNKTHTPLTPFISATEQARLRRISAPTILPQEDYVSIDGFKVEFTMRASVRNTIVEYDIKFYATSSFHTVTIFTTQGLYGVVRIPVSS